MKFEYFFYTSKFYKLIQFYFRVEYIQLALQYKPLNLGQGFPDFYAPENVTKALAAATTSDNPLMNQYTRGFVSKLLNMFFLYFFIKRQILVIVKQFLLRFF